MKIIMIGQGGHSKVIKDIILSNKGFEIVGYLDDQYKDLTIVDHIFCGPISSAYEMINKINQ
ncbi:acetyltransferase, partial [Bacillus pseudomycoides]